jgi:hypothetical protein
LTGLNINIISTCSATRIIINKTKITPGLISGQVLPSLRYSEYLFIINLNLKFLDSTHVVNFFKLKFNAHTLLGRRAYTLSLNGVFYVMVAESVVKS